MIKNQVDQIQGQIIENGGVHCGWNSTDHNDYLRIRQKYQGRLTIAFINQVKGVIPEQSQTTVRQHYQSHEKYKKLFQSKKKLIQQYKFAKMKKQKGLLQEAEQDQQINRVILRPGSGFRAGIATGKQNLNRSNSMTGMRNDKKMQIQKWRLDKQKQKHSKLQQEQEKKQKDKQNLMKKLQLQEKKRQEVNQYRERKKLRQAQDIQIRQRQMHEIQKKNLDVQTMKKIKERQQQALKRKQVVNQEMKIKQAEYQLRQELRLQAMHKKYEKIQPKLNQATAAASSKVRSKFDGQGRDAMTMAGNLLGTTSRAIPVWRKGQ